MKTTAWIGLGLTLALGGLTAAVLAQEGTAQSGDPATVEEPVGSGDFTDLIPPDLDAPREPDVCPDWPPRPEWAENLEGWEVQRSLLLSAIYEARSYETIVATGDCSCANRAPSWDTADAEYQENYAQLDLQAQTEAESEFRRLKNSLRREARAICQEQGNW